MRAYSVAFGFLGLALLGGRAATARGRGPTQPTELRIRVCATAALATPVPCGGRAGAARVSSRGADLRTPLGPPDLRGDTLALPGELEATLTDHSEVAFASLDSAEYLHVQVFEPGAQRPLLKATGHRVVVRHAPGEGNLWVEAR